MDDISAHTLAAALVQSVCDELSAALRKIQHCLRQLSDEQVWWRPAPNLNSIGNLLLHLSGNVRQWIVCGLSGSPDRRDRPAEFAADRAASGEELLRQLADTVAEAQAVLRGVSPQDLLRERRIQGFQLTGLQAIFDSVPHFRGHTQEIVHLTRHQLGDRYQFDFVPATKEQGAPE